MVVGVRCQVVNDDILSKYYYAIALTKATTLSQKKKIGGDDNFHS